MRAVIMSNVTSASMIFVGFVSSRGRNIAPLLGDIFSAIDTKHLVKFFKRRRFEF